MSTIATLSTSDTPADTLITKFNDNFSNLNTDKLEASDIAGKQNTLVSGTNIKTLNSNSLLGSGDLSIPTLTDGDKWDITLTSSASVWTIDNGAVTNAKQANVATSTIKWRVTVGTGSVEDLTGTQATTILDVATTSLKGLMSSTDKTKLDSVSSGAWTFVWCSLYHSSSQTFSDASLTYAIFNSEFFDTDWFHDVSTNNSRITIPSWKAWKYLVSWNIQTWTYSATWRFTIRLAKNWVLTWVCQQSYWLSTDIYSNTWGFNITTIMDLSVWDYIELWLACSWVAVVSDVSLNNNKNFSAYKIG